MPPSAVVFLALGTLLLLIGAVLRALGSFAYVGAIAIGLFFVAAGLIARAVRSPGLRAAAVLALAAIVLLVFGLAGTPFFYAGWGLLAGSIALALVQGRRRKAP